jgi:hypothetical protein
MAKIEKRIVQEIHPNQYLRTWHTTCPINTIEGICNAVKCSPGREPKADEWGGTQSTIENSPKAFALAKAIASIPGVKEAAVEHFDLRVEIYDAFDFEGDKIVAQVLLEIRRHVYTMRSKVVISDHSNNTQALHDRHNPPHDGYDFR